MEKEKISQGKATLFVVMAAIVCSLVTYAVTAAIVGEKRFEAGVESGIGQLAKATTGQAYELKLVGVKDGKVHELESSYGYTLNGQSVAKRIPAEAVVGDNVVCVRAGDEIRIISHP